jgi:protein-tyrosine phosphatase
MLRTALALSLLTLAAPVALAHEGHDHAHGAAVDSRFVLLEGGRNFRDVGGYRTADGRLVKSGRLYRSGSLGGLTAEGQTALSKLGVVRIVDLRTSDERSRDAFDLKAAYGERYWTRDYAMSLGDARSFFSDPSKLTGEAMRNLMANAYRSMVREQVPSYRLLFAELVAGKQPIVVNCTAGKDRTGIATALVLTALGVPYETVRADFLLSNGAPGMDTLHSSLSPAMPKLPAEVIAPLIGVEGIYLDNAFDQMRKDHGSVEGFLEKELGVGPKEIAALRARMLT